MDITSYTHSYTHLGLEFLVLLAGGVLGALIKRAVFHGR